MLMKNLNKKVLKKGLSINNDIYELLLKDERILVSIFLFIYIYLLELLVVS